MIKVHSYLWPLFAVIGLIVARSTIAAAEDIGQPLAGNAKRVLETLEYLGQPLPGSEAKQLREAIEKRDVEAIQAALDGHVLFQVDINPELRVKVARGKAAPTLQQGG